MNFFGHALVAQRSEATRGSIRAEFVLGAMLPDFATMLGLRPPAAGTDPLQAGIRFHHQTDDAFHGSQSFLEFSGQAWRFLSDRGLSRGSARAVAHVGVELLLDGAFASDNAASVAYLSAIECGLTERAASCIHWPTMNGAARFETLCQRLQQRGAFPSDTPEALIAARLRSILADRPRLVMDDRGQSVVRDWIVMARPTIVSGAPQLLREVQQRLLGEVQQRLT